MDNSYKNLVIECPHCKENVLISRLNCRIFRHGVLKKNGKQIDPHSCKDLCDFYVKKELIFGCGKPFQVIVNDNSRSQHDKFIAIIYNYI
jgi:hypothetical protein